MYRALVSFGGLISMVSGEVRDIPDQAIAKDLLKAGYIEPVNPPKAEKPKAEKVEKPDEPKEEKPKKSTTKKKTTKKKSTPKKED